MSSSSSSTTETTTYSINKYSRSYYPKPSTATSEWQHFTNPVLRLHLDITRQSASDKTLQSLRLRVVWTMTAAKSEQDIVLEDLELLEFSSLDTGGDSPSLKGVHRDLTFGFRYMYVPESVGPHKAFRRFQISFLTSAAVTQFASIMQNICPITDQSTKSALPSAPSVLSRTLTQSLVLHPPREQQQQQRNESQIAEPIHPAPLSSSPAALPGSSQPPLMMNRPSVDPSPTTSQATGLTKSSSLPDSTPPSSMGMGMGPPPLPAPSSSMTSAHGESQAAAAAADVVGMLRDATGLYDLPRDALERLIGDVIREDGFPRLLDKMSAMWSVKAAVAD